jgi:hypothetical protein
MDSIKIKTVSLIAILAVATILMVGCTKAQKAEQTANANKVIKNSQLIVNVMQAWGDKDFYFCVDKNYNYYVINDKTSNNGKENLRIVETLELSDSQIEVANSLMDRIDNYKMSNGDYAMDGIRLDMYHNSNEVHTEYQFMSDAQTKVLVEEIMSYSKKQNVIKKFDILK